MRFVPKPVDTIRFPSWLHCGVSSDGEDCTSKLVAPEPESLIVKVTPTGALLTLTTLSLATIEPGCAAVSEEGETAMIRQEAKMVTRPCFTTNSLEKQPYKKNRMIG